MRPRLLAPILTLALCLVGCASLASRDVRFTQAGTRYHVRDTGAVIVGKKQVGYVRGDRIVDSFDKPLAWLHKDTIRLRGGTTLPVIVKKDGTTFVPVDAQREAGLKPVAERIRPDGTMAATEGAEGIPVSGAHIARNRPLILALLILEANQLWTTTPAQQPRRPPPPPDDDDDDDDRMTF